mgnify:CR=1 FL=1
MTKDRTYDLEERSVEKSDRLLPLLKETDELIAILFSSIETAKKNLKHED